MPKWRPEIARTGALVAMLTAVFLAAPAAAEIYAWRTDDGVFAYTDNPDRIPPRYAGEAVRVEDTRLEDYPRLTRPDAAATRAVAARMEKRLEYLRRLNAVDAPARSTRGEDPALDRLVGDARARTLDVRFPEDAEPLVFERVRTKRDGHPTTRHSTLVKRGDRVVAVIKGEPNHFSPSRDLHEEDELFGAKD